jgi:hypothetical protein
MVCADEGQYPLLVHVPGIRRSAASVRNDSLAHTRHAHARTCTTRQNKYIWASCSFVLGERVEGLAFGKSGCSVQKFGMGQKRYERATSRYH